jgi:hypothetical protein
LLNAAVATLYTVQIQISFQIQFGGSFGWSYRKETWISSAVVWVIKDEQELEECEKRKRTEEREYAAKELVYT